MTLTDAHKQRISDERLRIACHPQELQIAPRWSNALIDCGELALDLRDCRARLAEVEREDERRYGIAQAAVAGAAKDRVALAAEQARTKALREALTRRIPEKSHDVWQHGYGCDAECGPSGNPMCTCGAWAQIDADRSLLASPSPQDALREVCERVAREALSAMHAYMMWEHDRSEVEAQKPDAAAIVASVLKEVGHAS